MFMTARNFLERFRILERQGSPLGLLADDSEGLAAAVSELPDEFLATVQEATSRGHGTPADIVPGSFASAACDPDGLVVVADPSFLTWLERDDLLEPVIAKIRAGEPHLSMIVDDHSGRPVAIAAGDHRAVTEWPLSEAVRAALTDGDARYAVLAFRPDASGWRRASRVLGLTRAETQLVAALAREGNLKTAAARLNIAYETARKTIATAMERSGTSRQTDLVRKAMQIAAGDLKAPAHVERLLADLFGLNLRQSRIARQISLGATRGNVASALGISEHAVKTGLKDVFVACGVSSAVDLARLVAEVDALAGLATACDVELNLGQADEEPLQLIPRSWAPGRIATVDYGPADARPLMIYQTNTMSRAISHRFIHQLQAEGFRPIIFDRSGYGLTDFVDDDPYAVTAHDAVEVLDALGCERAIIVSRGFACGAVTAAHLYPERFLGGVLLGPDIPVEMDRTRTGMMGVGRMIFYDNPRLARAMANLLAQRTNSVSIAKMMRESVAGSAIDLEALDDPVEIATIVRSNRQASLGMEGFLAETQRQGQGGRAPALEDGSGWTIAYGVGDPLYRFEDGREHWLKTLPGVEVVPVADGGRYLHLTHGELVAGLCQEVAKRVGLSV